MSAARPRPGLLLVAVLACSLLFAPAALAATSHVFTGTFGDAEPTSPTNVEDPYPLSNPSDTAVDNSAGPSHGDVYVSDPANHRVEKFDSEGHFLLMFGKEVNKTAVAEKATRSSEEGVCPAAGHPSDECQVGTAARTPGAFDAPGNFFRLLLAVDNSAGPSAGDVYVGNHGKGACDNYVTKFDPEGHLISSWGHEGQLNGETWQLFQPDCGAISRFNEDFDAVNGMAVDSAGRLWVDANMGSSLMEFSSLGSFLPPARQLPDNASNGGGLALDPLGDFYLPNSRALIGVYKYTSRGTPIGQIDAQEALGLALDPTTGDLYSDDVINVNSRVGETIRHFAAGCASPCTALDEFGAAQLKKGALGLSIAAGSDDLYVADVGDHDVAVFNGVGPIPTAEAPSPTGPTSVSLAGHIEAAGRGEVTGCTFEYGTNTTYASGSAPCEGSAPYEGQVDAELSGLELNRAYHFRLRAANATGPGYSTDRTFRTPGRPRIDGVFTSGLTATSADISAKVDPNGAETTYLLRYGPTTAYGEETAPLTLPAGHGDQAVHIHLEGLQAGATYHISLLAENEFGEATSEDQSFGFYPPVCPNQAVRQQTGSERLPDCRAYELVSPEEEGDALIFPAGGPNTGLATSPSRLAYLTWGGVVPGANGEPANTIGDMYVATRTDSGWRSRYVGLPASQTFLVGGPPWTDAIVNSVSMYGVVKWQQGILADPSLSKLVDWNDGQYETSHGFNGQGPGIGSSNAPYVWDADTGALIERWPSGLVDGPGDSATVETLAQGAAGRNERQKLSLGAAVAGGSFTLSLEGKTTAAISAAASGAELASALEKLSTVGAGNLVVSGPSGGPWTIEFIFGKAETNVPQLTVAPEKLIGLEEFSGETTASADLSHFVFSSESPLTVAPGGVANSIYDDDTATGQISIASKTSAGANLAGVKPLKVSAEGTRILMSTGTGLCKGTIATAPSCGPGILYMRVNDAATYEVSAGKKVSYVGMSADGSKVFFTSAEALLPEDHDTSTDLYMWSAAKAEGEEAPLTLISKGDDAGNPGEAGQSDACSAAWSEKCGIGTVVFTDPKTGGYTQLLGGLGGNGRSDTAIAAESGDVYFYSPELLAGPGEGEKNAENLYLYRGGAVQFVATLSPEGTVCTTQQEIICSSGPVARMQVTPDGAHMAFITANRLTAYENDEHPEMYSYLPGEAGQHGTIVCDSCIPDGEPPAGEVFASQDGLFLTNDGRAFFSTEDALVPADTNQAEDVYEYVDGRAQLISSGTGAGYRTSFGIIGIQTQPGLVGVSANGTDVYFASYEHLVEQDLNGEELVIYDARVDGGFPTQEPAPPCAAADECHGEGSAAPGAPADGTGAALGAQGNAAPAPARHAKKKTHKRHAHRRAHRGRGGKR
jgi:hypothetical protein